MQQELKSKEYLKDCFMQKCQDEYESFQKDEESALAKYANLSIKYLHLISLGVVSIPVLLKLSTVNFTLISQFIGLFILVFAICSVLIIRHVVNNKDDHRLRLKIYSALQSSILLGVIVNFTLYLVSDNAHNELLGIVVIATFLSIAIQNGIKRSTSLTT